MFCFSFHLEMTWYFHVFHLWYRVKQHQLIKALLYDLSFKKKQFRFENYFYCMFVIFRVMVTSLNPLITLCCSPFYLVVCLFYKISLCLNFQRVYSVGDRYSITYFYWFTCMISFNSCFSVYPVWELPTNVTLANVLAITSVS